MLFIVANNFLQAQYAPVTFDYEKSWFNGGGVMPAEEYFTVNGPVSPATQLVEFSISKNARSNELFTASWSRAYGNQAQTFVLPVNFPLRGNSDYTFSIKYFIAATEFERAGLIQELKNRFGAYVDQMVEVSSRNIRLRDNYHVVMQDLNEIMVVSMQEYRNLNGVKFNGFSSIVEKRIQQLEDLKLKRAFLYVGKEKDEEKVNAKSELLNQQLDAIKKLIGEEAEQYVGNNLLSLFENKIIEDYPTEKTMQVLPVNFGYAGVYESGSGKNLSYGTAPFVGVSFPLGNKIFSSNFLSNTSLSAGVMLTNITMSSDNSYTGPIVKLPIYAALGYKVLNMFRINAGATLLQYNNQTGIDETDAIYLRPFIGASLEINVWAGFSKKY